MSDWLRRVSVQARCWLAVSPQFKGHGEMAEVLRMFGSPVLFFREVANSEIVWFRAILPVALHVAGVSVSSSVVVAGQVEGAVIFIAIMLSVVSTFIGLLVVFWCYVGVVILFDLLFSFSREYRKLIECIALHTGLLLSGRALRRSRLLAGSCLAIFRWIS